MQSLLDIRRKIAAGALSLDDAVQHSLNAVRERDGKVRAFLHVAETPRPGPRGPLSGIAVGVKDIVDTADMPTTMGSPIYAGWRPKADAAVVSALKAAGATILGKTTTTPFAFLDPTETRNPANLEHTPGGSSAGSAAAVAAGMVPLAIGTQTGGSVIRPASFCGVAAIKPSFRLIPTVGVKTYAWTLDTVGLFAATVPDVAAAFEAVTGRRCGESPAEPLKFGVVTQDFADPAEPDCVAALQRAAAALERAGAQVRALGVPAALAEGWAAHPIVQGFESKAALAWEYETHRAELPPLLGAELDNAKAVTASLYDDARRTANRARREAKELFRDVDLILTYSAPGPAPQGLGSTGQARFNRLWTLLGTPCVNVPGLKAENGLPVGLQVIAPFAKDALALTGGTFLEAALAR